jgi:NAD(P)-dependent dehydrogenase (short-subunit alcohol dehydrogenase family)
MLLEVSNLTKSFGGLQVLHDVSFALKEGEILGLIGPNGAGKSILFTSSIVGTTSDPGICGYATSKHALIGLMRTVAKEVAGRNIRVNVVCPGPIENSFQADVETALSAVMGKNATEVLDAATPLGRHARVEEIAQMVLFLASDRSSYSTGSIFMADGGMNA